MSVLLKRAFVIFLIVTVIFLSFVGIYLWVSLNKTHSKFNAVQFASGSNYYIFTFTLNDEFITTPVPIKDVKGNLLATAKLSVKAHYSGNVWGNSVLVPLVIQKTNGDMITFSGTKSPDLTDGKIPEFVSWLKDVANWKKGKTRWVDLALDPASVFKLNPDLPSQTYLSDIITSYQKGREIEIQNFLNNGDPKIGLVIPIVVDPSNN